MIKTINGKKAPYGTPIGDLIFRAQSSTNTPATAKGPAGKSTKAATTQTTQLPGSTTAANDNSNELKESPIIKRKLNPIAPDHLSAPLTRGRRRKQKEREGMAEESKSKDQTSPQTSAKKVKIDVPEETKTSTVQAAEDRVTPSDKEALPTDKIRNRIMRESEKSGLPIFRNMSRKRGQGYEPPECVVM